MEAASRRGGHPSLRFHQWPERLKVWTQWLWLVTLIVPTVLVLMRDPGAFSGVVHCVGDNKGDSRPSVPLFGAVLTVGVASMTPMGKCADYPRFKPAKKAEQAYIANSMFLMGQ